MAGTAAGTLVGAAAGCVGGGLIALTAFRHATDSRAESRCRHCNASTPPGVTPEQFDMKSERQLLRIASRCACVGCCAIVTLADKHSARKTGAAFRTFHTGNLPRAKVPSTQVYKDREAESRPWKVARPCGAACIKGIELNREVGEASDGDVWERGLQK